MNELIDNIIINSIVLESFVLNQFEKKNSKNLFSDTFDVNESLGVTNTNYSRERISFFNRILYQCISKTKLFYNIAILIFFILYVFKSFMTFLSKRKTLFNFNSKSKIFVPYSYNYLMNSINSKYIKDKFKTNRNFKLNISLLPVIANYNVRFNFIKLFNRLYHQLIIIQKINHTYREYLYKNNLVFLNIKFDIYSTLKIVQLYFLYLYLKNNRNIYIHTTCQNDRFSFLFAFLRANKLFIKKLIIHQHGYLNRNIFNINNITSIFGDLKVDDFLYINKEDAYLYKKYVYKTMRIVDYDSPIKLMNIPPYNTKKIKVLILLHPYFEEDIKYALNKIDLFYFKYKKNIQEKYLFYYKNHPAYNRLNIKNYSKNLLLREIPINKLYPNVDIIIGYNSIINVTYQKYKKKIFYYRDIYIFLDELLKGF